MRGVLSRPETTEIVSAGDTPRTPLGQLTTLPQTT